MALSGPCNWTSRRMLVSPTLLVQESLWGSLDIWLFATDRVPGAAGDEEMLATTLFINF